MVQEAIAPAALIGVMFLMAEKTFEWGSLRLFGKVPKQDIFVGLLVGGVTIIADLAIVVILGVIVSALVFAWEHAKEISANQYTDEKGWRVYELKGSLFFASVAAFQNIFNPANDPEDVVIDFKNAKVVDHSALATIDGLAVRYQAAGKKTAFKAS